MFLVSRKGLFWAQALALLAALVVICAAGLASAQVGSGQVGPGNAAQPNTTIPEKQAKPNSSKNNPSAADLAKKKDGVIVPKRDVDPDMTKAPPGHTGDKMQVVPNGTDGKPAAQPK